MAKSKNKKVTLSVNSVVYDSFQKYCEENAIMLSKKVEIWMNKELKGLKDRNKGKTRGVRGKNKKITLSIDSKIYDSFRQYCEDNAILISKIIEIWMKEEMEKNNE